MFEVKILEDGSIFTYFGVTTIEDIHKANHLRYRNPMFDHHKFLVADFTKADTSSTDQHDAIEPAGSEYGHAHSVPPKKIAVVSTEAHLIDMFNIYTQTFISLASESRIFNWKFEAFHTLEEALTWAKPE